MDRSVDEQLELLARAIAAQPNAADLYYQLAETHWRAGDVAGYAAFFRKAYLANTDRGEIKEPIFGAARRPAELRDRACALIGEGVSYSAVISSLAVAEAQLGNEAAVGSLIDYERFVRFATIEPPDGGSLEAFNRALADEIRSDLKFYGSPHSRAIRRAWRYNGIERASTPALRQLTQVLRRCASDYMRDLPADPAHPFIAARPLDLEIGGWAVVSDGSSHHESHIHPRAWATGVYYVVQPDVSKSSGDRKGWLTIGPPRALGATPSPAWEQRQMEPVPGSLVIMPGYFSHETKPMEVDQERICVAFEVHSAEMGTDG